MLLLTLRDTLTGREHAVEIPSSHGPTLRSSIQEIRNEVGERANGMFKYEKEESVTRASSALGRLASLINEVIPEEDPHYGR